MKVRTTAEEKGYCGFTLIELLVVVSIIALLSSIVLATLSRAKIRAIDATALGTSRNILSMVVDCQSEGYLINRPPEGLAQGGSICVGGQYSDVPWPRLPAPWVYVSGFPAQSPVDSLFVIQRPENLTQLYYLGCGYSGCRQQLAIISP